MKAKWIFVLVIGTMLLSACGSEPETGGPAALALLDEVADSMGGWDVLSSIERQENVTQGNDWDPMQAFEPGADRQINGFGRTLQIDFTRSSMRLAFDGERIYPNTAPVRFVEVIDGDVGMLQRTNADDETISSRMHPSRFAARMRDFNRLAPRVLSVARDAEGLTRLEDQTVDGKTIHILRYEDGGNAVEMQVDNFTKLPIRVTYTEDDPIYGDTLNELVYLDWRDSQVSATETGQPINARLPFSQAMFLNGVRYRQEESRNIINNGSFDDGTFEIAQEVRDEPENGERVMSQWILRRATGGFGYQGYAQPQAQTVELDEVVPGVLHARGSSHNSMIVEMEDHVIVVEAPLFEERSAAVIAAIEERFPDKPIRHTIVTHFHIDHSGGVRAYAATGATIVGHESIVPFLETMLSRPKTVRPDSLAAASGVTPAVEGVGSEPVELTDGTRTVQVIHVENEHAASMVIAYLPNEKIAFVSDLYSPGGDVLPENANALAFYRGVMAANLDVEQVVGGHGGVGPFRDLAQVMADVEN